MSDTSQGPGWWLASDGRWYPPETHPQYRPAAPLGVGPAMGMAPQPAPSATQSGGRRRQVVALTLLIAGAVCGLIGLALFVFSGVRGLLDATVYQAPMHAVIDCRSGTYYVYQETGSQVTAPGFSYTHSGFTTLTPDQVVVVGPDGRTLTTRSTNGAETITIDSRIYANAVGFDVPTAGEYSVTITPDSPTAVIIAPSLGNQLLSGAPWLILTLVGFPLAIVGLILVIQESSRRKRRGVLGPYGWQPT